MTWRHRRTLQPMSHSSRRHKLARQPSRGIKTRCAVCEPTILHQTVHIATRLPTAARRTPCVSPRLPLHWPTHCGLALTQPLIGHGSPACDYLNPSTLAPCHSSANTAAGFRALEGRRSHPRRAARPATASCARCDYGTRPKSSSGAQRARRSHHPDHRVENPAQQQRSSPSCTC